MEENKPKRDKKLSYNSIRALPQNKNLSEDEFNQLFNSMLMEKEYDEATKKKFDDILADFQNSYDLSEMLPNDKIVLNNLIRAMISLDKYEHLVHNIEKQGLTLSNLQLVKEINTFCDNLRKGISSMQDDLNITRKRRKNEKEASVINFIEDLKEKARKFYTQKMQMIYCERCGTLLATAWWLYPESKFQKITVRCERDIEGHQCGWIKTYSAKDLTEIGMRNKEDIPDTLK